MDNKALWKRVCMTDPQHVKPITGKQYRGNSPKPYWIVERLTDEFGPCGIGWGFTILSERMERLAEHDVLHIAVVRLWYMLGERRGELEQIGQTKATYLSAGKDGAAGRLIVDEDAPKKSVTDALVKCASYLGFAGDIFSGRWDDSKYVAEADRTWRERERPSMPAEDLAAWLRNIGAADASSIEAVFAAGLEAATALKDREAFVSIRAAGVKRRAALKEAA